MRSRASVCPAVIKTRHLGYDGKGQAIILAPVTIPAASGPHSARSAVLEAFVTARDARSP